MKACPNNAISVDESAIIVNKINQKPSGSIVSCLNCGLCADLCENESHKYVDGKLRYDPTMDTENTTHEIAIDACPINTLHEDEEMFIYDEFNEEELPTLAGFCVSCGKCVQVCDETGARQFMTHTWDGKVSEDCISCGICAEVAAFVLRYVRKMQSHCTGEQFLSIWINVSCVKTVQCIVRLMPFQNQQCIKMRLKTDSISLNSNYVCIADYVTKPVHMMQSMRLMASSL